MRLLCPTCPSLISSPGPKGLECSPSTPTMNSYFYKFMINLLKRFSSERKLLETRGAFIIRSAPCSPQHCMGRVGWGNGPSSAPSQHHQQPEVVSISLPRLLVVSADVSRANRLVFRMLRHHHISCSQPPRQSISLLNSVVRSRLC